MAVLGADKTDGPLPLTVNFSSAGSKDARAERVDPLQWDFGDGIAVSVDANPSHTYTAARPLHGGADGDRLVGQTASASTKITAGNTAPTVTVNTPVDGGTFAFGDNIPYTVTVTDPGGRRRSTATTSIVTFVLGHDTHGHAEQSDRLPGRPARPTRPTSPTAATCSASSARRYTDKGGAGGAPSLTTTGQTRSARSTRRSSSSSTSPARTPRPTPTAAAGVHRGSLAAGDWIQLNGPFNLLNINTITFRVADAAAGRHRRLAARRRSRSTRTRSPVRSCTTDNLVSTGGTDTWTSQTFPIALSGTHELFLVFREVTGGATGSNLFNLNWVEFNGAGVGVAP